MKTTTYDETKWKLAPVEPAPEQIAAASVAAWPAASEKDMQMAKAAVRIVLTKHMEAAPGASLDSIAAAMATMFPAYRAMLAAAPEPPAQPVVSEIIAELTQAVAKFPTWPTDPLHAVAVLNEECGELNKAALQQVYEPHKNKVGDVRKEALQTAAMAVRFLISLDVYKFNACEQHTQRGLEAACQKGGS